MKKAILIFCFLALAPLGNKTAFAEVVVVPTQSVQPVKVDDTGKKIGTMLEELLKYAPPNKKRNRVRDDDPLAMDEDYERVKNAAAPNPAGDFTPATDSGPFAQTARECGESKQRECSPSNFGGRTMCGLAVAKMIKCMSPSIGGSAGCTGACGHGKNYVDCSNGQMGQCGYTKISPTDPRCKQAGAVLSYRQSPTARGSIYGHVEFVCGDNKYCSVYRATHDRPWPRTPADACWFPKSSNSAGSGR